jgi:hypothetical protein
MSAASAVAIVPDVPLLFDRGDPPVVIATRVWAVMVYPTAPQRATEFVVRELISRGLGIFNLPDDALLEVPALWLKALLAGPNIDQLETEHKAAVQRGVTAGAVLLVLRYCESLKRKVYFNTAAEVLSQADERKQSWSPLGAATSPNKPEIHQAWKEMQSVAHLWAAAALVCTAASNGHIDPGVENIATLLEVAQGLAVWATASKFSSTGEPIIPASKIWPVPSFVTPQSLAFDRSELPSWCLEIIEGPQPPSK